MDFSKNTYVLILLIRVNVTIAYKYSIEGKYGLHVWDYMKFQKHNERRS